MSLVGSLEDLGLADILQIVSLAQKSGRLLLRSGGESGRILLRAGLVCGGAIKGERDNLRALLLEDGHIQPAQLEEASTLAEDEGLSLVSAVARVTAIETEVVESWRRQHTERSVMRMFAWANGEFSFEVREDIDPEDLELELTPGINTQYLAMEASRLQDEGVDLAGKSDSNDQTITQMDVATDPSRTDEESSPVDAMAFASARAADSDALSEDEEELRFDGEPDDAFDEPEETPPGVDSAAESSEARFDEEAAPSEPPELDCSAEAVALESESDSSESPIAKASESDPPASPVALEAPAPVAEAESDAAPAASSEVASDDVSESSASHDEPGPAAPAPAPPRVAEGSPVVAMDPDLSGLEWLKNALADDDRRVHIFQQAEPALTRVRQYLVRGVRPLVLVSPRIDGTFEAPEVAALVARLRGLAPGMPVLELICEGRDAPGAIEGTTGTVKRPIAPGHDPDGWFLYRPLADALREDLRSATREQATATRRPDAEVLGQLRALSRRLRNPQQEDVLSLVLEFAAENFDRVAVFMIRDDHALGMDGRGLPTGASAIRRIRWEANQLPALLRSALTERSGGYGDLRDPGNDSLVELLGGASAPSYAAPIESGGCVAALLYVDAGASDTLPDTTALEIVLHEAGLALDRALLERTLQSVEGSG